MMVYQYSSSAQRLCNVPTDGEVASDGVPGDARRSRIRACNQPTASGSAARRARQSDSGKTIVKVRVGEASALIMSR